VKYRKLGNTGLTVSELGFGTIPVLNGDVPVLPDYFHLDIEEALEVMEAAYQLGCNLYDTAIVPEYGDAEIKTGLFASKVGRENVILSDKARFYTGDEIYEAVEQSCRNLGTYADLYFVHQADEKNAEQIFEKYGALDALTECKAEGKIRFVGIASHYYSILYRGACDNRVDVLQGSGNILECGMLNRMEKEPRFQKKGFLVNKVYAAGILPSFFPIRTLIEGVLSYPVSSALIGLGTKEQVFMAMGETYNRYHRSSFEQVIAKLEQSFLPIPCDRCQKCYCPYGVEISVLFRQYNYYFLGKKYWALRKLDLNIRECAKLCRQCSNFFCMKSCPRNLPIPKLMQKLCEMTEMHVRNAWILS